jgi:hypothetical protein
MTDAKTTAVTRTSRNVRVLRIITGRTPDGVETYCVRSLLSSPATNKFAPRGLLQLLYAQERCLNAPPIFAALRGTGHLAPRS